MVKTTKVCPSNQPRRSQSSVLQEQQLLHAHTTLLRRWVNVEDVDSMSQQRCVSRGAMTHPCKCRRGNNAPKIIHFIGGQNYFPRKPTLAGAPRACDLAPYLWSTADSRNCVVIYRPRGVTSAHFITRVLTRRRGPARGYWAVPPPARPPTV